MATIKKYNGSTWENTTARKYETKSEIITPPTTIYTDGSNITTYSIKGNTVQNGTPTPSNPVDVVGVGTLDSGQYKIPISNGQQTTNIYLGSTQTTRQIKKIVLDGSEDYSVTGEGTDNAFFYTDFIEVCKDATSLMSTHFSVATIYSSTTTIGIRMAELSGEFRRIRIRPSNVSTMSTQDFKIWLANQYAADTPVTVWFALATPETSAVNEPLMKIGDYADTLSNATAIPTTDGANSITVDTTVQPSEFTATWAGWHDANVKEWDGSDWN